MMDRIGLVMVEDKEGIFIQAMLDPSAAEVAFNALSGKLSDSPWRATFLDIQFVPEFSVKGKSKDLPLKPDTSVVGFRLGHGPITEPEIKENPVDGKPTEKQEE